MLVPYGLGSHACVSAGVVDSLVMLTVARLLHRFDLELEPRDYRLKLSVTPFPAPSPKFKVRVLKERAPGSGAIGAGFDGELVDLLPDIGATTLSRASDRAETREYPAGTVIIRQGEQADAFFIITTGSVEVVKDGHPEILATLKDGDYFGEIGLIQNVPRTATVRAVTDVKAIVLNREAFFELIHDADLTSREIAEVLRRRLVSNSLAEALPQIPRDRVERLWPQCAWLVFRPAATIVQQGDPPDYFYVIVRGRVDVINTTASNRETVLCTLSEGDYFGEIGLLQGRPRTATVRASSDGPVELLALDKETFQAVMEGGAGKQIAAKVAERLHALTGTDS
jgi:CRP-like cAMP-binding protein